MEFPEDIKRAFLHQSNIGWDHFVRDRISMTWGAFVGNATHSAYPNYDTEKWGSKLISINFE